MLQVVPRSASVLWSTGPPIRRSPSSARTERTALRLAGTDAPPRTTCRSRVTFIDTIDLGADRSISAPGEKLTLGTTTIAPEYL